MNRSKIVRHPQDMYDCEMWKLDSILWKLGKSGIRRRFGIIAEQIAKEETSKQSKDKTLEEP